MKITLARMCDRFALNCFAHRIAPPVGAPSVRHGAGAATINSGSRQPVTGDVVRHRATFNLGSSLPRFTSLSAAR